MINILLIILYSALFFFKFNQLNLFATFSIGVVLGFGFRFFDQLLFFYYGKSPQKLVDLGRELIGQKKYFSLVRLAVVTGNQMKNLITDSILFIAGYVVMCFLIITSAGSVLGSGFVLGIGLSFLKRLLVDMRDIRGFHDKYLYLVKRDFDQREIQNLVMIYVVCFVFLSVLFFVS